MAIPEKLDHVPNRGEIGSVPIFIVDHVGDKSVRIGQFEIEDGFSGPYGREAANRIKAFKGGRMKEVGTVRQMLLLTGLIFPDNDREREFVKNNIERLRSVLDSSVEEEGEPLPAEENVEVAPSDLDGGVGEGEAAVEAEEGQAEEEEAEPAPAESGVKDLAFDVADAEPLMDLLEDDHFPVYQDMRSVLKASEVEVPDQTKAAVQRTYLEAVLSGDLEDADLVGAIREWA